MTGHPDYATVVFTYVPDQVCVELKAMKLYLHEYRNKGIFFEAASNKIFKDLFSVTQPKWARLETLWRGRGGIRSNVIVENQKQDYQGPKAELFKQ
jgi:7-cyano-7-deazaguanine reductase